MILQSDLTTYFSRRVFPMLVALSGAVQADVRLPSVISNHMVLQAGVPISIWGWATPTEEVSVTFSGQMGMTTTGADGKWEVKLAPVEKSAASLILTVKGRNTLNVEDVLVGEVWLGSGQSNMQLPVGRSKNFPNEKAAAKFPEIRRNLTKTKILKKKLPPASRCRRCLINWGSEPRNGL